jgi:hypothetical protein
MEPPFMWLLFIDELFIDELFIECIECIAEGLGLGFID